MFKKAAVLEAGNYKAFGMVEDYYMWARVMAKGKIAQNVPNVLVDVRVGKEMYNRRSGWNYFHMNKMVFDEMKKLGLLSFCRMCCRNILKSVYQWISIMAQDWKDMKS